MNQIVDIIHRSFRWMYRFRKRRGYGIHSPFAFNLVTGVIYEDGTYYAYHRLQRLRNAQNSVLRSKDDKLLFRLVNNIAPDNGVVIGDNIGITVKYLQAGREHADWHPLVYSGSDQLATLFATLGKLDFLYVDDPVHVSDVLNLAVDYVHDYSLVIIRGIHSTPGSLQQWKELIQDPRIRVTFDLHDFGLLYFEARLNKEDYIINYY